MITPDTIEAIVAFLATALTSVGGVRLYDRYKAKKAKFDIVKELTERTEELTQKLISNESMILKHSSRNTVLNVDLQKCQEKTKELASLIKRLKQRIQELEDGE